MAEIVRNEDELLRVLREKAIQLAEELDVFRLEPRSPPRDKETLQSLLGPERGLDLPGDPLQARQLPLQGLEIKTGKGGKLGHARKTHPYVGDHPGRGLAELHDLLPGVPLLPETEAFISGSRGEKRTFREQRRTVRAADQLSGKQLLRLLHGLKPQVLQGDGPAAPAHADQPSRGHGCHQEESRVVGEAECPPLQFPERLVQRGCRGCV